MKTIELYSGYGERTPEELRRDINDKVEKMTKLDMGDLYATLAVVALLVFAEIIYHFTGSLGWLRNILIMSLILFVVLGPIVWLMSKRLMSVIRQSSAECYLLTIKRYIKCYQTINAFAQCCLMGVIIADEPSEVIPVAIFMLVVFTILTLFIWLKPYGVKWFVEGKMGEVLADVEELDEYKLEE